MDKIESEPQDLEEEKLVTLSSKIKEDKSIEKSSKIDLVKTKDVTEKYFRGFTKRQLYTLIIFSISNLTSGAIMSLQAPFYPKEAEQKGASSSEYGFVFGIFNLTLIIFAPINGTLLGRISPKFMFCLGLFIAGISTILFGLLEFINDSKTFIIFSFIIRIVTAIGNSAETTASFTIIACEFPDTVSTAFATLETFIGLGLIIGPTIGGVLYQFGGFTLPFIVTGSLVTVVAILAIFVLPNAPAEMKQEEEKSQYGFISLITIPTILMAYFSIAVSSSTLEFLAATLEPHLRQEFNLTPIYTGLVFIIDGAMYALSAPLWGRLCDRTGQPKVVTLMGCILTFIGVIFIGPAPFMPFEPTLWVTCLGLAINGLGIGACLVSGFIIALEDAVSNGFSDNVATYGLVSGMWVSFLSLGAFVGPSVGGVLLDNFGFKWSSLYSLATQIIMGLVTIIFICKTKSNKEEEKSQDNFNDSLLHSQTIHEKLPVGKQPAVTYGSI